MDGNAPLIQLGELLLIGAICIVVLGAVAVYGVRRYRRHDGPPASRSIRRRVSFRARVRLRLKRRT